MREILISKTTLVQARLERAKYREVLNYYGIDPQLSKSEQLKNLIEKLHSRISDRAESEQPETSDVRSEELPPCVYRTPLDNDMILCAEEKRIPLSACLNRQKRYTSQGYKCKPVGHRPQKRLSYLTKRPPKARDHFCVLHQRRIPLDELPTLDCDSCQNTNKACLEEVRRLVG